MARTLLFLSADYFHATIWQAGKLEESQYFDNNSEGREAFSLFLSQHRHPAYLLVDVIEEDFRLEVVPHLAGSARRNLLARKFEQFYRGTQFHQATFLQRQAEGRRDDEMLFSALTNPQRISPWLDALHSNHIPLIGIYSLPNISTPLIKDIGSNHILLLSWEKDAGLRQTYFNYGRLHFSRLIPININGSFSESVAEETPRTQQYLKSLSLPPPGELLDVIIICNESDKMTMQSRLSGDSELRYTYLDVRELGQRFKAKNDYADSDATPLLLHVLASKPPGSHYANSEHTHFYMLWKLRRILYGTAAAITLVSAALAGTEFLQARDYVAQTEPLSSQSGRANQQTQQIISTFAHTTVPAEDMKTAVLLARRLNLYSPPPADYLAPLTHVLDKFSQITITRISWEASGKDAAPSSYPAQVITLDGTLIGFGSNFRNELSYLDTFQQALIRQGYTVTALKQPLDVSPKGQISGDEQKKDQGPAPFTLKIIWRHKE